MNNKSNINMYYEEVVSSMAERAADDIKNGVEENEAIMQAIDDGLIYYADQAYIVAHALQNGFIKWGQECEWDAIFEDLYADVSAELGELKEAKEKENDN